MLTVIEHTEYPFARGNLTADGIQWSAEKDTEGAGVDVEVEKVTISPPALGAVFEVEFGLSAAFKAISSATADLTYKWQARNKGGTWVDLHAPALKANIGTTYIEETRSGRFKTVSNFNSVPFEVRLVIQCDEASQGRARTRNNGFVRIKYSAS